MTKAKRFKGKENENQTLLKKKLEKKFWQSDWQTRKLKQRQNTLNWLNKTRGFENFRRRGTLVDYD